MWLINSINIDVRLWPPYIRLRPIRMAKHFWQRRVRGFDDADLWSLDIPVAEFVLPRLKAFRAMERHGVPMAFLSDKVDHIDKEMARGEAKFNDAIDKMIYAFECILDEEKDMPELPEVEFTDNNVVFIGDDSGEQRKAYHEARRERQAKIDEGLALFGKYLQNLWD